AIRKCGQINGVRPVGIGWTQRTYGDASGYSRGVLRGPRDVAKRAPGSLSFTRSPCPLRPFVPRSRVPEQKKRARAAAADPLWVSVDSVRVHSGGRLLRPSGDQAPDDEHDERTADRAQPGRQREELIHLGTEDGPSEPAAEHGSDDTDDERGEDPATLLAGKDCLGDGSGDESEDQICDETHDAHVPSESGDRLWSGPSGHGKTAARGLCQDVLILYDIGTHVRAGPGAGPRAGPGVSRSAGPASARGRPELGPG